MARSPSRASRGHLELQDAELDPLRRFPSPEERRNIAARDEPDPAVTELRHSSKSCVFRCSPPEVSIPTRSLLSPLSIPRLGRTLGCPGRRQFELPGRHPPLSLDRAKVEEDLSLFAVGPVRNPVTFSFVFVSCILSRKPLNLIDSLDPVQSEVFCMNYVYALGFLRIYP
jgi:hypothetical protein